MILISRDVSFYVFLSGFCLFPLFGRGLWAIGDVKMEENDFQVWQLIQYSETLLKKAHTSLLQHGMPSTDSINNYNMLIKASLNCLFKILRHYSTILDANIQSILYYKTAQILFRETISWNLASDYCTKGIQICKRNEPKLTLLRLKLQYLNFQIKCELTEERNNALSYLNHTINHEIPSISASYLDVKLFFEFIKFQKFKAQFSAQKNILHLKNILKILDSNLSDQNYAFQKLVLIHLIEYQLSNNSNVGEIIQNVDRLHVNDTTRIPIQFKAISLLFSTLISLKSCDLNEINNHIQKLDQFINSIKSSKNPWSAKISFTFMINKSEYFPFELSWLSFKQFTIVSYFYTSILYSFTSWDKKNKSNKLFKLIESSDLKSKAVSSFDELQNQVITINYMKIIFSMYQLLSDFIKDKYPEINDLPISIRNLINNYEHYSSHEKIIYNTLIPTLKYILAIVHQRNKEYEKALYYYIEIIQKSSSPKQLVLICILNAIPTLQFIIEEEKLKHKEISEFDIVYDSTMLKFSKLLKLKDSLFNNLSTLQNSINITDNILLELTIKTIRYFYSSSLFSSKSIPKIGDIQEIEAKSPLLASLLYLMNGYSYVNDPGLSELENINLKVSYFNKACKYSVKMIDNNKLNSIAKLGYFEIWKIMDKNKNLYNNENINHVYEKFQHFNDNDTVNCNKRVKFV